MQALAPSPFASGSDALAPTLPSPPLPAPPRKGCYATSHPRESPGLAENFHKAVQMSEVMLRRSVELSRDGARASDSDPHVRPKQPALQGGTSTRRLLPH